jgi:hypothetical protein
MTASPTPISLTESYFQIELTRSSLKFFDGVKDATWIDFAQNYLARMKRGFTAGFLDSPEEYDNQVRLYFEPRLASHWERVVTQFHQAAPLLGASPYPAEVAAGEQQVSTMLEPLKKHLLFAHSVFLRDNFYYCFDMVADSVDPASWHSNPNLRQQVERSIGAIKNWLPILIELKDFIEAGVLVFMPYYITPSFPYGGNAPKTREAYERLRLKPDTKSAPATATSFDPRLWAPAWDLAPKWSESTKTEVRVSEEDVVAAWLNARLMGLDVAFPDQYAFDLGSRFYFDEPSDVPDVVTDLMSIEGLPFGDKRGISLKELWKIRKGEKVFNELRGVVARCKVHMETQLGEGATKQAANEICRTYLSDNVSELRGETTLRFLEGPTASVATSLIVGVGVSLVTANPLAGIAAGTALNPGFVRMVQNRVNRKRRAIGQLQTLL